MAKSIHLLCSLLSLLSLLWLTPAQAQSPGAKRLVTVPISDAPAYAKRALVVGVTDYALAPPLHVCGNDAKEFADLLKTRFGFTDVTLMTDDPKTAAALRPTCNNLRRAIHGLLKGIEPGKSEVVLFYSGHGVRLGTDSDWLVPEDGDPQDISHTCLNYTAIVQALNTERPKRAFLVTDACRSLLTGKAAGESSGFGKGLEGLSLGPEVAELLSCQPTEVSQEGMSADFPESVFTHFLVKGLEGDPDALDGTTKNVTFDSLKVYVQGQVSNYVRSHFNSTQLPDGRATLGRMVLARVGDSSRGITLPSLSASPIPVTPALQLTLEEQQKLDAKFVGLYESDKGFDQNKVLSLTPPVVLELLSQGANIHVKSPTGVTPLMAAIAAGFTDTAKLLVEKGADVNAKDNIGKTALSYAAYAGNAQVIRLLLTNGADVNAKRKDTGGSPLIEAAFSNHADAVRLLLDNAAEVNARTNGGITALMEAAGGGETPGNANADEIRLLIGKGVNVNATSDDGTTALMHAAGSGNAEAVSLLLAKGAAVNATSDAGVTALTWAGYRGDPDVIKLLLKSGADVKAKQSDGFTALKNATREGHSAVVTLLQAAGEKE